MKTFRLSEDINHGWSTIFSIDFIHLLIALNLLKNLFVLFLLALFNYPFVLFICVQFQITLDTELTHLNEDTVDKQPEGVNLVTSSTVGAR